MLKNLKYTFMSLCLIVVSALTAQAAETDQITAQGLTVMQNYLKARQNMKVGDATCSTFDIDVASEFAPPSKDDSWSKWAEACKNTCAQKGYSQKSNARMVDHSKFKRGTTVATIATSVGMKAKTKERNYTATCCCQ